MMSANYVITISRQAGSGGTILGKGLAKHFGFYYLDNEVLKSRAREWNREQTDEWIGSPSMGRSFLTPNLGGLPYLSDTWMITTDANLFRAESEIMKQTAEKGSCIITGRCGAYLFREQEKHVSLFLYADEASRIGRLERELSFSHDKAKKVIDRVDKERARYYSRHTGEKWLDMTGYDLCIDTGKLPEEEVKRLAIHYIEARFPQLKR